MAGRPELSWRQTETQPGAKGRPRRPDAGDYLRQLAAGRLKIINPPATLWFCTLQERSFGARARAAETLEGRQLGRATLFGAQKWRLALAAVGEQMLGANNAVLQPFFLSLSLSLSLPLEPNQAKRNQNNNNNWLQFNSNGTLWPTGSFFKPICRLGPGATEKRHRKARAQRAKVEESAPENPLLFQHILPTFFVRQSTSSLVFKKATTGRAAPPEEPKRVSERERGPENRGEWPSRRARGGG